MPKPFIVHGDKTHCGGFVAVVTSATEINGRLIARMGDVVQCCQGIPSPILAGDQTCLVDGKPAARQGDVVGGKCVGVLQASQITTTTL